MNRDSYSFEDQSVPQAVSSVVADPATSSRAPSRVVGLPQSSVRQLSRSFVNVAGEIGSRPTPLKIHQISAEFLGSTFLVEKDEEGIHVYHPTFGLSGDGSTMTDALIDLHRTVLALKRHFAAAPIAELTPGAVEFRQFLLEGLDV